MVLDINLLHTGGVVQTFSQLGTSSIYIRHPDRLRHQAPEGQAKNTHKFCVRREGSEEQMTVLLDTASTSFCVSESRLHKLQ